MIKKKLVLKKIKPTFTRLVTTADRYTFEDSITETGMVIPDMEGAIKDIQTVNFLNSSIHIYIVLP